MARRDNAVRLFLNGNKNWYERIAHAPHRHNRRRPCRPPHRFAAGRTRLSDGLVRPRIPHGRAIGRLYRCRHAGTFGRIGGSHGASGGAGAAKPADVAGAGAPLQHRCVYAAGRQPDGVAPARQAPSGAIRATSAPCRRPRRCRRTLAGRPHRRARRSPAAWAARRPP